MKIPFKNTAIWCWIWALIDRNHFYNLELVEFKAYSTPTAILIPFSNLGWFFPKISINYNLGKNRWDKIKTLFFSERTSLPSNQYCSQSCRLFRTKFFQIQDWYGWVRIRTWNLKNWDISWIYWILNFFLKTVFPGL